MLPNIILLCLGSLFVAVALAGTAAILANRLILGRGRPFMADLDAITVTAAFLAAGSALVWAAV